VFAIFLTKNKTELVNPYEAVIEYLKTNTFFIKLGCQLVMAVAAAKGGFVKASAFCLPLFGSG